MVAEVVVQLFATVKIGAVFIPIFSGFAPPTVAERLRDAGAKVWFIADGTVRLGEFLGLKSNAYRGQSSLPGLQECVVAQGKRWSAHRNTCFAPQLSPVRFGRH